MKRKLLNLLLVILVPSTFYAQNVDAIIFLNGDTIYANVIEVGIKDISYQYENERSINMAKISKLSRINFASGRIQVFKKQKEKKEPIFSKVSDIKIAKIKIPEFHSFISAGPKLALDEPLRNYSRRFGLSIKYISEFTLVDYFKIGPTLSYNCTAERRNLNILYFPADNPINSSNNYYAITFWHNIGLGLKIGYQLNKKLQIHLEPSLEANFVSHGYTNSENFVYNNYIGINPHGISMSLGGSYHFNNRSYLFLDLKANRLLSSLINTNIIYDTYIIIGYGRSLLNKKDK